jgi:hypothetical protein
VERDPIDGAEAAEIAGEVGGLDGGGHQSGQESRKPPGHSAIWAFGSVGRIVAAGLTI